MAVTLRRRAVLASAAVLVTALGLTGCVPSACPAIGWSDSVTVRLDEDSATVARVQLCTDDGCAPAEHPDSAGPVESVSVASQDADAWTFSVDMSFPREFTVRALAADGTVISDTERAPEWVRVGGSARCGGPSRATVAVEL